jgi:hypothetical protein
VVALITAGRPSALDFLRCDLLNLNPRPAALLGQTKAPREAAMSYPSQEPPFQGGPMYPQQVAPGYGQPASQGYGPGVQGYGPPAPGYGQQPAPAWQQQPPPGYPPPPPVRKKKSKVWLVLGIIAAVLALVCGGAIACTALVASNLPDSPGTGTGAATVGINQPARDGKFEFTVTGVQCGVKHIGPASFGSDAQGQFCLVKVTVTNIGNEAQMFTGINVYGFNAAGQKFDTDTSAAIYLEGDARSFLENINPGNTVNGTLVFDIPVGQSLKKLELHDSLLSGGVIVNL